MPYEISTEIRIDASAQRVWEILIDFARYPEWNHFLLKVKGASVVDSRIRFTFELPRGLRARACATVLKVIPEKELRWAGGVRGLFRAEHYFLIESADNGAIRFQHGEVFTGLFAPLIWRLLLARGGPPVYHGMNTALKERSEAPSITL